MFIILQEPIANIKLQSFVCKANVLTVLGVLMDPNILPSKDPYV